MALAAGSLGLTAITFQGITHMAPAAGVMLSAPFIASFAGPAMGLAFGFAGVAALFLANSVAQLAKHLPSAGGYFSYISRALNPKLGFMAGWMYFLYDPIVPILCTVIIGGYTEDTLDAQYGINFPWWAYSIIVWLGLGVITFLGVKPSIATAIILTLVEVGITLALSFTIFAQQGVTSHDLKRASRSSGIPGDDQVHGLFLAMVFSVLSYTGFESTAPLAEETRNPKRNVAIAAIVGTALILVYYVIFGFATALGFGIDNVAADFPVRDQPVLHDRRGRLGQRGDDHRPPRADQQRLGLLAGRAERGHPRVLQDGHGRRVPARVRAAFTRATARRTWRSGCRPCSTSSSASSAAGTSAPSTRSASVAP